MKLQLFVSGFDITDKEQEYVKSKLGALSKFSDALKYKKEAVMVHVHLEKRSVHTGGQAYIGRVTMSVPHAVIRGEAGGSSVQEIVDLVVDKLKRQIERYKQKHLHTVHNVIKASELVGAMADEAVDVVESVSEQEYKITRRKLFTDLFPMSEQQAIATMEALGHGFFIFVNEATDRYNLVYNRLNSDGYGLIELEHSHGVIHG